MPESAGIFVHGILSSTETWKSLLTLLETDSEVSTFYDLMCFPYPSPRFSLRPDRRIPDYNTLADSLGTYIEVECTQYRHLVLVGHSQGGLIIQRYLARRLADSRGLDLQRIRRVVLLACPNNGSELLLMLRRSLKFWKHPQERELRPINSAVVEAQRRVLSGIVFTKEVSPGSCPIPFSVYAGESDNVVPPASANSVFPRARALPGDHNSILDAMSAGNRTFKALRDDLLSSVDFGRQQHGSTELRSQDRVAVLSTPHAATTPFVKVTTTTTQEQVTQSQTIEIFDLNVANAWIERGGSSDVTE
jgi:Alpha/beta hydrolase family